MTEEELAREFAKGPRVPRTAAWKIVRLRPLSYRRGHILAITDRVMAKAPDGSGDVILQDHVSFSRIGGHTGPTKIRASDADVRLGCRAFGIADGAEEDNHEPGIARHFWRPVDPARRVDCECKDAEETIVDPRDGFKWTNPKPETGEACRGCTYGAFWSRPCPIHGVPR